MNYNVVVENSAFLHPKFEGDAQMKVSKVIKLKK